MKKFLILLPILAAVLVVGALTSGIVSGKAHVPAGMVQISHKGMVVKTFPAAALGGHLRHGDIQLPACDFNNVFGDGADVSNVVSSDLSGVAYSDKPFQPRADAGGITPACPPGLF